MRTREAEQRWVDFLSDEELSFVKRFVLASGSLKAVATAYAVSYPTVRARLDRLIAKVNVADDAGITSEFERVARARYADGAIDMHTLKVLLAAHRTEMEDRHEKLRRDR